MRRDDMLELVIVIWQMIYRAKTVSIISMAFKTQVSVSLCKDRTHKRGATKGNEWGIARSSQEFAYSNVHARGGEGGKAICCWVQLGSVQFLH